MWAMVHYWRRDPGDAASMEAISNANREAVFLVVVAICVVGGVLSGVIAPGRRAAHAAAAGAVFAACLLWGVGAGQLTSLSALAGLLPIVPAFALGGLAASVVAVCWNRLTRSE